MRKLAILAAAGSLLALQACAATDTDTSTTGAFAQGLECATNSGIDITKAALAVAMAEELGEIDPVAQLEVSGGMVVLKSGVCPDECPKTEALLDFQHPDTNDYIPQEVFNAISYREDLKAALQRQKDWEHHLEMNDPQSLPAAHSLVFAETTDLGACGIHYVFDAYDGGCTASVSEAPPPAVDVLYKADNTDPSDGQMAFSFRISASEDVDLSTLKVRYELTPEDSPWNADAQLVTECYWSSGSCPTGVIGDGHVDFELSGSLAAGDTYQAAVSIHLDDWGTQDEANDKSARLSMTSFGANSDLVAMSSSVAESNTGSCVPFEKPEDLKNRMEFFGGDNNAFLDVRTDGNQIMIDPDLLDSGDSSTSSGSCEEAAMCRVYDPDWTRLDGCCICNGNYGTWKVHPRNANYLYCKT